MLVSTTSGAAEGLPLDANTFEWRYDQHTKEATLLACNAVRRQAKSRLFHVNFPGTLRRSIGSLR